MLFNAIGVSICTSGWLAVNFKATARRWLRGNSCRYSTSASCKYVSKGNKRRRDKKIFGEKRTMKRGRKKIVGSSKRENESVFQRIINLAGERKGGKKAIFQPGARNYFNASVTTAASLKIIQHRRRNYLRTIHADAWFLRSLLFASFSYNSFATNPRAYYYSALTGSFHIQIFVAASPIFSTFILSDVPSRQVCFERFFVSLVPGIFKCRATELRAAKNRGKKEEGSITKQSSTLTTSAFKVSRTMAQMVHAVRTEL